MIFANYMVIWEENIEDVEMESEKWYQIGGLKIGAEKSEVIAVERDKDIEGKILLNGGPLKVVGNLIYPGSQITNSGKFSRDIS